MGGWMKRRRGSSATGRKKIKRTSTRGSGGFGRRWKRTVRKRNITGFKNVTTKAKWPGLVMPQKVIKKFEFEDDFSLDSTAFNTQTSRLYRTNDIYDPSFSTVASDQSVQNYATFINASLYQKWRVYGAKITLTAMNLGGSMAMVLPMISNYDAIQVTSGATEATMNDWTALPTAAKPFYLGPITSGTNMKTKSFYVAPWVALGLSRMQYSNDPLTLDEYNARVGKQSLFQINMIGVGGQQAVVKIRINIVYYVNLFELVDGVNRSDPGTDPGTSR